MRKKKCDWCGYPFILSHAHGYCIPKPDYHDTEAYFRWMNDPERPTREGRKYMRELSEWEQKKLDRVIEYDYSQKD